jgi:3-deoxy-manno-octulosonate cytidylyltransferase (CMP-KDO synthetase)
MYAYRTDVLKTITRLEISSLEKAESLEQLRWIENGFEIKVAVTNLETIGIDTPEDIAKALAFMKNPGFTASPGYH